MGFPGQVKTVPSVVPDEFKVAWVGGNVTRFIGGDLVRSRAKALSIAKASARYDDRVHHSIVYAVFGEKLVEIERFKKERI